MCWVCCHPSSCDRCGCSLCPPRHILSTPWGPCVLWVLPGAFLVLSHGLECWLQMEPGKEQPSSSWAGLLGALQAVPGALGSQLFPCWSLLLVQNACVSSFQKFLHSSPHFILYSTAVFGQTLCVCLLTISVGIP